MIDKQSKMVVIPAQAGIQVLKQLNSAVILSLILVVLVFTSCSKSKPAVSTPAPVATAQTQTQAKAAPPAPVKKAEPIKYVYPYATERDPFLPLMGEGSPATTAKGMDIGGKKGTELANLLLKGIVSDRRGKVALMATTDGISYSLKSGRVYDSRNQMVSGVTGIIKDNTIILITQNKTIRELAMRHETESAPAQGSPAPAQPAGGTR